MTHPLSSGLIFQWISQIPAAVASPNFSVALWSQGRLGNVAEGGPCVTNSEFPSFLPLLKSMQSKINIPCPAIRWIGNMQTSLKAEDKTSPGFAQVSPNMWKINGQIIPETTPSCVEATKEF